MEMTPLQIASEYRTAANKSKQIKVLAELNLVTQRRIAEILQEQGEELPGHWKEKLATPLKREPRPAPATQKDINDAVLEAVTGEKAEKFRQEPAALLPARVEGAALSLDEIRQAALTLILERSPGESVRFQGYALGVAALVQALEEKAEARK